VYAVIDRFHGAVDDISATLAQFSGLSVESLANHLTIHFDRGVPQHLFSVAAGLRSAVPGEFEVLGQLRRALDVARDEQVAGSELDDLFHRALAAGRKVRTDTHIARGTTSFAQATVELAAEEMGGLSGRRVVVVGAGQLAIGVVRGLLAAKVEAVVVLNRTLGTARDFVTSLDDARASARPLSDLRSQLATADLVICAAEAPELLIHAADIPLDRGPLWLIDVAMPRVIDAAVSDHPHVVRRDIGDLRRVVEASLSTRHGEMAVATDLVTGEVERFLRDRRERGAASIVTDLRDAWESIRAIEWERRRRDFDDLTDEQRERVDALTRTLLAKLAHGPSAALKESAGTDRGARLAEAARTLFDL
jgi:glutamyl-tRNA reductase